MAWKHRDPWTRAPHSLALEPRIMFDAAGAETYADLAEPLEDGPPASGDPAPRLEIVFIDERLAERRRYSKRSEMRKSSCWLRTSTVSTRSRLRSPD